MTGTNAGMIKPDYQPPASVLLGGIARWARQFNIAVRVRNVALLKDSACRSDQKMSGSGTGRPKSVSRKSKSQP